MAKEKQSSKKIREKATQQRTFNGFSRFLYAMNLMLETASHGKHKLHRDETLLLSLFRDGNGHPHSLKHVDREFRNLLVVRSDNPMVTTALKTAVAGLVDKGLLQGVNSGATIRITEKGKDELKRVSEIMDAVWARLTKALNKADRAALRELIHRINPAASSSPRNATRRKGS